MKTVLSAMKDQTHPNKKKQKSRDADVSENEPGRSKSSRMKDGLARAASYTS